MERAADIHNRHNGRLPEGVKQARAYFPRGLFQPAGSFRFSLDALLLASFADKLLEWNPDALGTEDPGHSRALLDLGCGCGVAGLGFLTRRPDFTAWGVDFQAPLVDAALQNADLLGFSGTFAALTADLASFHSREDWPKALAGFDLVLANPPYRLPGRGRLPLSPARRLALFGDADNLRHFVRAASLALSENGIFCVIFPASRFGELAECLKICSLHVDLAVPVRPGAGEETSTVLAAARGAAASGKIIARLGKGGEYVQPGASARKLELVLHNGHGGSRSFSAEALEFCPFLGKRRSAFYT